MKPIENMITCSSCDGSGEGFYPGSLCFTCKGMGEVRSDEAEERYNDQEGFDQ